MHYEQISRLSLLVTSYLLNYVTYREVIIDSHSMMYVDSECNICYKYGLWL